MACMRCDGLLVPDDFVDLREVNGPMEFQGVRCINCGYIGDAIILTNRHQSRPPLLGQPIADGRRWVEEPVGARQRTIRYRSY